MEYMAVRHSQHTMNQKLLKAVSIGDADLLEDILGVWSTAAAEGAYESFLRGVTAEGSSALHIAASRGYLNIVSTICTRDSSLVKARNNYLDTPLICAARAGHAAVVLHLVEHALAKQEVGHTVLRAWNSAGATAMHEAVRNGHGSVLRTLMLMDSRLATMVDGKGFSALYLAIVSNRVDMVEILVRESHDGKKSPASYAGPNGQTALHAAVYASRAEEICESLLCWQPTLGEKVDNYGRTALHYAAHANKIGVVKLLLGNGSLAYIPDNNGQFAVHDAAITGKVNVLREFMKICPSIDELRDNKHKNILHRAIEHGRLMVVRHILRNQQLAHMLNAVDSEGNTPLHLAVKHGHLIIFLQLMMDMRVNLGIINHDGLTALEVAYYEIYRNSSFSTFKNFYTICCLELCEAYSQKLTDKLCFDDKKFSSYTDVSQAISCISVLIAAASYAAAFAPPGGYKAEGADAGMPVLGNHVTLLQHIVQNSTSFFSSMFATCLVVHANLITNISMRTRRLYLAASGLLVYAAVYFMLRSFMQVVLLQLDPDNYFDDFVFFMIIMLADALVTAFAVAFPFLILVGPICLRVSWQLRTSKHKLHGILKVLLSIICALILVSFCVIDANDLAQFLADDEKYLHPT